MTNHEITIDELSGEPLADATPIDVRSPTEFATGHIPGAVNIPLPELQARCADIRGRQLVLVCERGTRAEAARTALLPSRPDAKVLSGGMHAWRQAQLPLIRSVRTVWPLERQVRLIAGCLVLAGVVLGLTLGGVWLLAAAVPGAGLVLAGLTDFCPMGLLLLRMPWNQVCPSGASVPEKGAVAD